MKIVNREEFLAIPGNVLFREVTANMEPGEYKWEPKAYTDPLMIRIGDSIDGDYYEAAIASSNLKDFILFSRGTHFEGGPLDLDPTPCRGDSTNKYFLVYSKEDVKTIINELLNILV